jgi:hypothetical protein
MNLLPSVTRSWAFRKSETAHAESHLVNTVIDEISFGFSTNLSEAEPIAPYHLA